MKIGIVLDDTLDTNDGVQQYVLLVGEWMREQGHDVHYLVGQTNTRKAENVHSLSRNFRVAFNKNRLSIPIKVNKTKLHSLMKNHVWDVLHVQMPYSPFLSGRVISAASLNTAVVATFHIAPHSKSVFLGTKALSKVAKKSTSRINSVISVSDVAKEFVNKTYGLSSTVIPNAIDIKSWQTKQKINRHVSICFIGRLVKRKGCHLLIQALILLNNQNKLSDLRIVIAGDGPERQKLEMLVKKNNLHKIVTFLGYVSEQKKRDILTNSKLTVLPATGGESFGIVLLEAMAAGSVVIAGDNPGYRSVLGEISESMVNLSPRKIAEKIDKLFHDSTAFKDLNKEQQVLVKNYDINSVGSDILGIYEQAISRLQQQ